MTPLLIITVNYRTADLTIRCIQSVARELEQLPGTRMRIIDNDSGDGSVEKISQAIKENQWQDWVTVTPAERNGGFSYGNNIAIRDAMSDKKPPELIWLLNPDAELKPGAALALVNFMHNHPETGLSTSSSVDKDGIEQPMAFRRFTIISEFISNLRLGFVDRLFPNSVVPIWPASEAYQADWLSGSSLIIRLQVFKDIGLMDENYFLYFEESDFCLQAQRKGWQLWYVPESRILHLIGASTGFNPDDRKMPRRPGYWFESRRRYFLKNFGKFYLATADVAHLTGFSIWRLRRLIQNKPDFDPPHYLKDFFMNSVFVKGFSLK